MPDPEYEGRLELTWTNKHLRLLAHDDGRYEWVPPSDYRVAEVKMDKEMESDSVKGKRDAALRWANHVNDDGSADAHWRYLLVSETDVKTARSSWESLKHLGGVT